jgi:hypothetical protein
VLLKLVQQMPTRRRRCHADDAIAMGKVVETGGGGSAGQQLPGADHPVLDAVGAADKAWKLALAIGKRMANCGQLWHRHLSFWDGLTRPNPNRRLPVGDRPLAVVAAAGKCRWRIGTRPASPGRTLWQCPRPRLRQTWPTGRRTRGKLNGDWGKVWEYN